MIQIESVGGGEQSSSQPYDELGGQYASFSGGTPGFDWGAVGKGIQSAGSTYAQSAMQTPNFMTGAQGFQPASMQQAAPFNVGDQGTVIQPPKSDAELQAFVDALRRLGSTGKSAGSYYYVDPRAMTQQQSYDDEQGHIGQLLPYGTQPGF